MFTGSQRLLRYGLTTLTLTALFMLCANHIFFVYMVSPYLSAALLGGLIILEAIRRSWADLLWVLAGASALAGFDYGVLKYRVDIYGPLSLVGMAAIAVLSVRTIWAKTRDDRTTLLYGLIPTILLMVCNVGATPLHRLTTYLHPKTFDLFLNAFDCSLRVQFSFFLGQVFMMWPWVRFFCMLVYIALALVLALVYAGLLQRNRQHATVAIVAFVLTEVAGFCLYNVLPACGPLYIYRELFPWHPLTTAAAMRLNVVPIPVAGLRNAMPSLHMSWVLLAWWNSRGLPRWMRSIALIFVVMTTIATLGSGEHYLIDLVVAFPYALAVQAASTYTLPYRSERRSALLFGTFTTLIWFALLSYAVGIFWMSPVLPWAAIVATIAPSIYLWNRLMSASRQERPAPLLAAAAHAGA